MRHGFGEHVTKTRAEHHDELRTSGTSMLANNSAFPGDHDAFFAPPYRVKSSLPQYLDCPLTHIRVVVTASVLAAVTATPP